MRAVNLLPIDERAGRHRPPAAAVAVAGAGVLAASLLTFAFVSANGKVDEREPELTALERELATARRATQAKRSQPTVSTEHQQRLTALNSALGEQVAWDRVLREVSLVLPEDVWLSSLGAASAGASGAASTTSTPEAATGRTVTFNGFTYSQESVARLLRRLALVPHFGNVKLEKSSVTTVGSQQIYGFTVLADVATGAGNP
jgi:Tfp pilus assembly protein PilN